MMQGNRRESAALGCGGPRDGGTEGHLVEQPAIALRAGLGWRGGQRLRRA